MMFLVFLVPFEGTTSTSFPLSGCSCWFPSDDEDVEK